MTGGGPNYRTYFFGLNIYLTSFRSLQFGYASTIAWILFILIASLTLFVMSTSRRWVYYAGETVTGARRKDPWQPHKKLLSRASTDNFKISRIGVKWSRRIQCHSYLPGTDRRGSHLDDPFFLDAEHQSQNDRRGADLAD